MFKGLRFEGFGVWGLVFESFAVWCLRALGFEGFGV